MIEFPKIDTLFERGDNFKVIGQLKRPEFGLVKNWVVQEKIDGTNIRIDLRNVEAVEVRTWQDDEARLVGGQDVVTFAGRTDKADLPGPLLDHLKEVFTIERFSAVISEPVDSFTLYGEGYGSKIQKGGDYRDDQGFILFDVLVSDRFWLKPEDVHLIATRMGIPHVPVIGTAFTAGYAAELVKAGLASQAAVRDRPAEGIIARPTENLFDQRGRRVMWKLKTKDFANGV